MSTRKHLNADEVREEDHSLIKLEIFSVELTDYEKHVPMSKN